MNVFQQAVRAGYSCIPCHGKIPSVSSWKKYMECRPSTSEAEGWTGNIAIICGKISGGLVCVDFDVKNGDKWNEWQLDVNNIEPKVLSKIYVETTPSGGYHVCYRSPENSRNAKLACNKDGAATIETRGEGGYFVCAPSIGYSVYFGKLSTLKKITESEESILLAVAESYNEYEKEEYKPIHNKEVKGTTVLNRYDSVTDPVSILQAHGWKVVFNRGGKVYLRRPGKNDGISATWNAIPKRFYCFSTSTVFDSRKLYKPSAVYSVLEHNGDFSKAAKHLRNKGF